MLKNFPDAVKLLETGYGPAAAAAIRSYLDDFNVFADGFLPVSFTTPEKGGVRLLLARCPLALDYLGRSENGDSPVALGVLFTPHFPSRPPVCAILIEKEMPLALPTNPPAWLSVPSGSVQLHNLPGLSASDAADASPPLIDILLAVTEGLSAHRVEARTGPGQGAPTPNLPSASPSVSFGSGTPAATAAPSPSNQQNASSPQQQQQQRYSPQPGPGSSSPLLPFGSPSSAGPIANNNTAASPAAVIAVRHAMDCALADFIIQRESTDRRLAELRESQLTLQKLSQSLTDKKATLTAASAQLDEALAALQRAAGMDVTAADPLRAIEAPDPVRRQAADLLAEVLAFEDLLNIYERRLRKGNITAAAYMRLVGDASRLQFNAKYKLKKAHGVATARQSYANLAQRFPQMEPTDVAAVLAECGFSFSDAAQHLGEMTRGA